MHSITDVINASTFSPLPDIGVSLTNTSMDERLYRFVKKQREEIKRIICGEDSHLLVIIGPCSIHDPKAALEYAMRLAKIQEKYRDNLKIVMRTYFEKPRTRRGWKGYIVDPNLNGQFDLVQGLYRSRKLLKSILELGIPTATEFLDTNIAPYIADLICWGAIGARTTESQPHRQLASGLDCPIGFKNGTDGNTAISIDAIHAAQDNHVLIVSSADGTPMAAHTVGNKHCHIILRGGLTPNYSREHIKNTAEHLESNNLSPRLIVDCSHGNSSKIAKNQLKVVKDIATQLIDGEQNIAGVMCESFLKGGNQRLDQTLVYGKSITDECLDWEDSTVFLDTLAQAVEYYRKVHCLQSEIA